MSWVKLRLHLYHVEVDQLGDDMQMDDVRLLDVRILSCNQDSEEVLLVCVVLHAFYVYFEQVLVEQNVQNE